MLNVKKALCDVQEVENASKPRKLYRKPHLQELGDLRTLTLGGSPGAGDSGTSFTQRVQGAPPMDFFPPPEY